MITLLKLFTFNRTENRYELIENPNVVVHILPNSWYEVNIIYDKDPSRAWVYGQYNFLENALNKAIDVKDSIGKVA